MGMLPMWPGERSVGEGATEGAGGDTCEVAKAEVCDVEMV